MKTQQQAPDFSCGPRGVETKLVRDALPWLGIIAPLALGIGWLLEGGEGAFSAALGLLLAVANLFLSAAVLERAARMGPQALMGAAMFGFLFRMGCLLGVFYALQPFDIVDPGILGCVLIVTHLAILIIEAIVVTSANGSASAARAKVSLSAIDSSPNTEAASEKG